MKRHLVILGIIFVAVVVTTARAQVAVVPNADHEQMLASPDARLATNKRLVYDFWRVVFEGAPLVAIVADGNLVTLVFVREAVDPKDPAKKYTTTWFDMFRLEGGKIAEHWDPAPKRQ